MIEKFGGETMSVKKSITAARARASPPLPPPQVLLFSASFECLEPSYPSATRMLSFCDQVRSVWGALDC